MKTKLTALAAALGLMCATASFAQQVLPPRLPASVPPHLPPTTGPTFPQFPGDFASPSGRRVVVLKNDRSGLRLRFQDGALRGTIEVAGPGPGAVTQLWVGDLVDALVKSLEAIMTNGLEFKTCETTLKTDSNGTVVEYKSTCTGGKVGGGKK